MPNRAVSMKKADDIAAGFMKVNELKHYQLQEKAMKKH